MNIHGIANMLSGIVFILIGGAMMWFLIKIGTAIAQAFAYLSTSAGDPAQVAQAMGFFNTLITFGWVLSIVAIIAGVTNLISGYVFLKKKHKWPF